MQSSIHHDLDQCEQPPPVSWLLFHPSCCLFSTSNQSQPFKTWQTTSEAIQITTVLTTASEALQDLLPPPFLQL